MRGGEGKGGGTLDLVWMCDTPPRMYRLDLTCTHIVVPRLQVLCIVFTRAPSHTHTSHTHLTHILTHTLMHSHTNTHSHTHSCTHTHTHTCMTHLTRSNGTITVVENIPDMNPAIDIWGNLICSGRGKLSS